MSSFIRREAHLWSSFTCVNRESTSTSTFRIFSRVTEQASDQGNSGDQGSESYRLRPPLRHLAQWAFVPDGIPSLKFIACGDYAYGGRSSGSERVDVILCRPKAGPKRSSGSWTGLTTGRKRKGWVSLICIAISWKPAR